jgi:hypothetical protein
MQIYNESHSQVLLDAVRRYYHDGRLCDTHVHLQVRVMFKCAFAMCLLQGASVCQAHRAVLSAYSDTVGDELSSSPRAQTSPWLILHFTAPVDDEFAARNSGTQAKMTGADMRSAVDFAYRYNDTCSNVWA